MKFLLKKGSTLKGNKILRKGSKKDADIFSVCVKVLRPSQPNRVMSSVVSFVKHQENF